MPEGVAAGGKRLSKGVHDDPDRPPEPSEAAPKGWTWNRGTSSWQPKVRGKTLWQGGDEPAEKVFAAFDAGEKGTTEPPEIPGQRDPDPRHLSDDQPEPAADVEDVPQQVKDDIAGLAGLVGTPILAVLKSMDPYCGGALADAYEGIVDATLPLICRSSKIVRYFAEDKSDWMLWGKLAIALGPVARAIGEHHILRTVEVVKDEKTGAVQVRPRGPKAAGRGDPLQPPAQPEFQYAA